MAIRDILRHRESGQRRAKNTPQHGLAAGRSLNGSHGFNKQKKTVGRTRRFILDLSCIRPNELSQRVLVNSLNHFFKSKHP